MHDRKEGLENIEENFLEQRGQRSEIVREAERQHVQQNLPSTGKMLLHYFLAGIGVTIGFLIIGVGLRAVGLEDGHGFEHTAPSFVHEVATPDVDVLPEANADQEDSLQQRN